MDFLEENVTFKMQTWWRGPYAQPHARVDYNLVLKADFSPQKPTKNLTSWLQIFNSLWREKSLDIQSFILKQTPVTN